MTRLTIATFLFPALLVTGCASPNGLVSEGVSHWNGTPLKHYQSRLETIAMAPVRQVKMMFDNINHKYNLKADFDTSYTPTATGAIITMEYKSPRAFFPLGEYDIRNNTRHDGRDGAIFSELVRLSTLEMAKNLQKAGVSHRLIATFFAQADGVPVKRKRYDGEFGTVRMGREITTLNGFPMGFTIHPGQRISNEEIAALRAYSLRALVHSSNPSLIEDRFQLKTVSQRGRKYRKARVSFIIEDK